PVSRPRGRPRQGNARRVDRDRRGLGRRREEEPRLREEEVAMTPRSSTIAMLMFTACAGSGGGCKGKGDDSTGDTCNIQLDSSFPDDGAADMCFRSDVEFTFQGVPADVEFTLADSSGANVPGTTSS